MTPLTDTAYTFSGTTSLAFDDAVALTEIDVQATLEEKLDEEIPPYLILGACNPRYAHRTLELEPELGALLPCNVAVYTQQDGTTRVSAIDPVAMLALVGRTDLEPIADEIQEKIDRALQNVWAA